jgi:8-oxo-dGTP pyrophosphatase MutT (NUDIX family)
VVVRGDEVAVIVPVKRAADGSQVLALPKGHLDHGESPLEAATREVREEAGLDVELVGELGQTRYHYERKYRSVAKAVTFYLFRYTSGDVADHDSEIERAFWMSLDEAQQALTYEGEREMVARALALLRASR